MKKKNVFHFTRAYFFACCSIVGAHVFFLFSVFGDAVAPHSSSFAPFLLIAFLAPEGVPTETRRYTPRTPSHSPAPDAAETPAMPIHAQFDEKRDVRKHTDTKRRRGKKALALSIITIEEPTCTPLPTLLPHQSVAKKRKAVYSKHIPSTRQNAREPFPRMHIPPNVSATKTKKIGGYPSE